MNKYILILCCFYCTLFSEIKLPENGSHLRYIHILFEWDQEPNATAYNFQTSSQSNFNILNLDIIEETTVYLDTESFTWSLPWYCRVRPVYDDGSFGSWSSVSSFSTDEPILTNLDVNIYDESQYL